MITVGTGVGGGIFVDGEPYRGSRGLGGEIGHMVVDLDGPPCPCGGQGHLEAFLGRPAIAAKGREAATQYKGASHQAGRRRRRRCDHRRGGRHRCEAGRPGRAGDPARGGDILGRALVGFVNILNPKLIVVGGGIGEAADFLVERAAEVMQAEALAGRRDVKVVQAVLGNDAGILGAAALAFDEHDSREGLHR